MGAVSRSEFESLLGDVGREAFVAFVADLWAARGADTTVSGAVIEILDREDAARLRVFHTSTWNRLPVSLETSLTPAELADVDVLVSNVDSEHLRDLADATDTGFVGPARLRQLTLYAIDRETGEDLLDHYFDYDLNRGETTEPTAGRGDDKVNAPPVSNTDEGRFDDLPGLRTAAVVAVVVLMLSTASLAGPVGRLPVLSNSPGRTGDTGAPVIGDTVDENYPPGLTSSGLANLTALASAHGDALENRTFYLTIRHRGTRGQLVTTGRWYRSRQLVRRNGAGHLRYTVEGELPPTTVGSSPDPVQFEVELRDETCSGTIDVYGRNPDPSDPCELVAPGGNLSFTRLTASYLSRYLDEEDSSVRTIASSDGSRFRLMVTDVPDKFPVPATNYTAVAEVDESGLVRSLSVSYETPVVDRSGPVRFSFQFGAVGVGKTSTPSESIRMEIRGEVSMGPRTGSAHRLSATRRFPSVDVARFA